MKAHGNQLNNCKETNTHTHGHIIIACYMKDRRTTEIDCFRGSDSNLHLIQYANFVYVICMCIGNEWNSEERAKYK